MARRELVKSDKVLKIGQRIEVAVTNDGQDEFYASRIEDFDARTLVLAMPMVKGYPIIPSAGGSVYVRAIANTAIYTFVSIFIAKRAKPIPVLVVTMPDEVEKYQRRAFVRINARIPLMVQIEDEEKNLSPVIYTNTTDISGGGLRLTMDCCLSKGVRLYIESGNIPVVGKIEGWCEVVRSVRMTSESKTFSVGTKFINLSKVIQGNLIRYIFKRQREMLSLKVLD